ncbi:hypothetical protein ACFX15_013203 [Malus domestica]
MVKGEPFHFTLEPYGPITPDRCKTRTGFRNILCSIQKEQRGWWKRLLKTEEKPAPYIKGAFLPPLIFPSSSISLQPHNHWNIPHNHHSSGSTTIAASIPSVKSVVQLADAAPNEFQNRSSLTTTHSTNSVFEAHPGTKSSRIVIKLMNVQGSRQTGQRESQVRRGR